MAAPRKKAAKQTFRSEALAQALEKQDMAAVALALRNGNTIVPLLKPGPKDSPLDGGEVWTFRDAEGNVALLLFSDAKNKPANLPPAMGEFSPLWLRDFLDAHEGVITTVFFDIAGPHTMQADPADLRAVLA